MRCGTGDYTFRMAVPFLVMPSPLLSPGGFFIFFSFFSPPFLALTFFISRSRDPYDFGGFFVVFLFSFHRRRFLAS